VRPGPRRAARFGAVAIAAVVALVLAPQALADTWVVNSTADSNDGSCTPTFCTLRDAIVAANGNPGPDTIDFYTFTPSYLIQPATALPAITGVTTIDGSGTSVQIDGSNAGPALYGLDFEGALGSIAENLSVTGWNRGNGAGIKVGSGADVTVTGSYIGTDWSESSATSGNYSGIEVDGTATIGGAYPNGNNIVDNTTGVAIFGSAVVHGNWFGPAGGAAGNGFQAILVQSSSPTIEIGGTGSGDFNQITGNGMGIRVIDPSTGVQIRRNFIGAIGPSSTNSGGGIVFGNDNGHTPNDTGDSDTGPNGLQNYPLLTDAYTDGSNLHVSGTLNSTASTSFTVEFFVSTSCNASGFGQGEAFVGDVATSTDGSGNAGFSTASLPNYTTGVVTATATGPDGTSEFSNCVSIGSDAPKTFTVTSTSDTPTGSCGATCTLRDALNAADDHAGPDTIAFAIPGSGVHTITAGSAIVIPDPVMIDGTTQPGWTEGHPVIEVAGSGGDGLSLTGGQSTVRGLIVDGFDTQISITGGAGHTIAGNYLATDSTGTTTNGGQGVDIEGADDVLIGGTSSADRNVIGGDGMGVEVGGGTGNVIEGNYIGLGPDGTTQDGAVNGVSLDADGNTVGGTAAGAGNAIAVSTNGITIGSGGSNASNNLVEGNSIGTTADETQVLGGDVGIDIESGENNQIGIANGGPDVASANVIAGSGDVGILVRSGNNTIASNFVGTNRSGSIYGVPNASGVRQLSGTPQNTYAYNTVAGSRGLGFEIDDGAAALSVNTITGNAAAGVQVNGVSGIVITENSIDANGGPGIELANGGNNDQPAPSLSTATLGASSIEVTGSLPSPTPAHTYKLEFFRSTSCGSGSNPQGATFIGSTNATPGPDGQINFDSTFQPLVGSGDTITATATDQDGSTSELSACITASVSDSTQTGPVFTVNTNADPGDGTCTVGDCTLREAIDAANAYGAAHGGAMSTIDFALAGGSTSIDVFGNPLPAITAPVTIDGYTQAGTHANTLSTGGDAVLAVELTNGYSNVTNALELGAGSAGSTVRGLVIDGAFDTAVAVGDSGITVAGNFIGTNVAGTGAGSGFLLVGVGVTGAADIVGGTDPADRNVIANAGLSAGGVDLNGAVGATVQGNYIGTDASGTSSVANGTGVDITGASGNTVVGNLISGNQGAGLAMTGASDNTIALNRIGTTADGTAELQNGVGVTVDANSTGNTIGGTLGGNLISGNGGAGVAVDGAQTTISGNEIGTDLAGTAAVPNAEWGILDNGAGTTIGGATVGDRNLISGNTDDAIEVTGAGGSAVEGNWIGVDSTGNAPLGNSGAGIRVTAPATITGNVVSGNGQTGIFVIGSDATPVSIAGNLVGTNAAGTAAVPNISDGVHVEGTAAGVTIGGPSVSDRNVVSGNTGHGIHVTGEAAGATIEGNYAGIDAAGATAIGNGIDGIALDGAYSTTVSGNVSSGNTGMGISLFSGSSGNSVQANTLGLGANGGALPNFEGIRVDGASGNVIGATTQGDGSIDPSEGNEVADNTRTGIAVYGASTGNWIRGNRVHDNGELGIDLSLVTATAVQHADGVTPNDAGDVDTGPNNLQNFPVLAAATLHSSYTEITGSLQTADGSYRVDFYASAACDQSGNGEGARWIGWADVQVTNDAGSIDTGDGITAPISPGEAITATATDPNGNTSEFSPCVTASSTATGATATLTSASSVGISGSNDLLSEIPLRAFETPQSGTTPAPINGLPINGLPINGLPINGLPINGLPINGLPINGLPINGLPINGLPINGLPINGLPINGLPLSDLPINGLAVPGGWEALLAGTPLAGKPLQTITLQDVLSLPTPPSITLGELDLSTSTLGRMTIGALALGSTPINGLGSEASTIESDLQSWCESVVTSGDPATDCSVANIGRQSLFALGLAGAPINGLPINGLPINGLPINGLPINGLPINGLDLSASPINGLPINGLPINGLPLGTLPINRLSSPGDVCTDSTCGGATTLAEAQANGAIKPGATLGDLHFYDDLTIGDLEQSLDGPDSTVTLGDLIGLLIKRADVPWETLPPRLLSAFDPNRPTLALTAGFTLQGPVSGQSPATVAVTLPDGFDYVPGSAGAFGDPTVSGGTLTWNVPNVPFGTPQALSFDVWSGTSVGPTQATERVTAGSAADSSTAAFDVTDSFEPNDTVEQATTITPDQNVELSAIGSRGDVDYYKVPMPPAGTRLQVHLTNLTADYDLALYAGQTTSVRTGTAGNVPLQDGAIPDQSLNLQGGVNPQLTPTALQDVPDPGIPAVQVSANRGTDDEDVGMVSPGGGGYAYIAVFGYNGASSPDPYTLRVTTKAPQTVSCPARTFGFAGQGTAGTVPSLASLPANLNTLILVNEKRIGDTYGVGEEANVVSSLTRLAGDNGLGVSGAVIPVEGLAQSQYDAWDANPCDSGAANAVANAIADEVDQVKAARSGLEYVVFVGGDDQIPFFRLPDLSYIANETGFAGQFGQNEYYGALAGGNLLSDNPYLDTRPVPASGRQLFIPDLVGGRLVETPGEITGAIQRFEDAGGALDASSAFVSGYDFVSDGSELVRQRLEASLPAGSVGSMINDTWSKDDLLAAAFPAGGPAAINDWNGHYDNYQALAANGDQSNLLSTSTLTGAYALSGGIFFTMGCHAGFQTTDAIVGATAPDRLDWAEYFAGTGTGFVGNTGFGLGNTDSVAFSEELMADLAGHLDGTASIGQALEAAKRDYYLSRLAFSSYDEKTLSEAELYGLPMYGVGSAPAPVAAAAQPAAAQPAAAPPDPVTGTMSSTSPSEGSLSPFFGSAQTAGFDAVPDFSVRQTGAHGDYYTNAGQVQAPNYRPLQPYVTLPATRSGLTAHGVVVDALTSRDDSPFNPDNVRPTLDLSAHEPEPQFADEAWPTKVPTLVSLDDALGLDQELNLATGQFFTDTGGSTPAGVERLWTHIGGRVTYSTSPDFVPPTIDQIDAFLTNGTVAFTGRFSDRTETGAAGTVVFAQVVYDVDSSGTWQAVQLQRDPSTGAWSGGAPFTGAHVQFFVEACDLAGNCGYSSNKGRYFDAAPLPAPTGSITITPSGPAGSGAWFTGPVNVDIASATGADVTVSVDGAPFVPLSSPLTLSGDGSHTIDARGSDGSEAFAVVLIDGTPPDVDLTLPPTAGIGEHVAVAFACTDRGSGVTSCTATQNGSPVSNGGSLDTSHAGTVQVVVSTEDAAGNAKQVTKSVVIGKATPTITWPAPPPITYGTKLGPAQLDATASVPGTFVYDPPAGTVLQPGVQTLSVTFTPANTADFTTATATVHITVGFTQPCITTRRTGPFKVEEGTSICVSGGASITGPITIEKGGALWVGGATLTGPYKATKAAALTLCNTRVTGPITVSGSAGYVLFGGVAATGCAGNTITGPVKITDGSGGLSFARNHVTGPVTITGNHGGFIFTGNTITGPVHVSGNS
jgi:CSLREA domain-containing protein